MGRIAQPLPANQPGRSAKLTVPPLSLHDINSMHHSLKGTYNPNCPQRAARHTSNAAEFCTRNQAVIGSMVATKQSKGGASVRTDQEITQMNTLVQLASQLDLAGGRLDQTLSIISKSVCKTINVDRVSIWRITPDGDELRCLEAFTPSPARIPTVNVIQTEKHPRYFAALKTSRVLDTRDVIDDERTTSLNDDYWKVLNIKSSIDVPIRMIGQVEGVLRCEQIGEKREWAQEEVYFTCQIADLIAQSFLETEMKTRDLQLSTIQTTLKQLTSEYRLHDLLKEMLERTIKSVRATSGMLFFSEFDNRTVRCVNSVGGTQDYTGVTLDFGEGVAGEVAETGTITHITDHRKWPRRSDIFDEDTPYTTVLAVPITRMNEVVGVIQVMRTAEGPRFTERDVESLNLIANQIAMVIENSRLTDRAKRNERFQETLNRIAATTSISTVIPDMLVVTLDDLLRLLVLQMGMIKMDKHEIMMGLPSYAGTAINKSLRQELEVLQTTITEEGTPTGRLHITTVTPAMEQSGIQASIVIPIVIKDIVRGYLGFFTVTPRKWTREEIKMLGTIGNQLRMAVERIHFSQETTAQINMMERLSAVSRSLNRVMTHDDTVLVIGQGIRRLTHADQAAIYVRKRDGTINCPWYYGLSPMHIDSLSTSEGKILAEQLLASQEPVIISDTSTMVIDPQFKKFADSEGFGSINLWPMVHNGEITGAIACFFDEPLNLTHKELEAMQTFSHQSTMALQNARLYSQLEKNYLDMALALANAMDARETLISTYSTRLANWAEKTAQELGCSEQELKDIQWAARLHDIGKAEIPNDVLRKPGPLSEDEWEMIQMYPVAGEKYVRPISRFNNVSKILRNYREHYNGYGYPDGLKGIDIPLGARILAVADAYGSMIDERSYKQALTHQEAITELQRCSDNQFDPVVVDAFIRRIGTRRNRANQ